MHFHISDFIENSKFRNYIKIYPQIDDTARHIHHYSQ